MGSDARRRSLANEPDVEFERQVARLSRFIGLGVAAAGLSVLAGWAFDIPALKSLLPGLPTMKANTAVAFVLCGASLWRSRPPAAKPTLTALVSPILAAMAGGLALLTLGEYVFGWRLGIDQWLVRDSASPAGSHPGRMAPMTALNFTALAAALVLIDVETPRRKRPSNWLALFITANSFLAILGYIYGVDALYRLAAYSSVALPTALLCLLSCAGVVCARPGARFVRQIATDGPAGIISRRLLPAAVLIPPFFGWLRWEAELAGYIGTAFGIALFATSNVAVFTTLVWWSANSAERLHQQKLALSRTSDWQQAILNSADFTMISTDTQGTIRTINLGAANMLGYSPHELVDRATPASLHDPSEVAARAEVLSRELGREVAPGFDAFVARARDLGRDENDWTYIRKDGSRFPVRLSVTPLVDTDGTPSGFLGIGKDISAQKIAEEALRDSERRMRLIADNVPALISYIDRDRRFRFNNATYAQWLGRPLEDITGRRLDEVYDAAMCALLLPPIEEAFDGASPTFEFASPTDGRFIRGTYIPDVGSEGVVIGVYALIHDITIQKEAEAKLRQLAQFDSLTGLANRNRFDDKLAEAIARSERSGQSLALAFLDLDHFKSINDSLGHHGGDLVLQEFGKRLSGRVRATDTVARLGGDEFVIVLEALKVPADVRRVAATIVAAMEEPMQILSEQRAVSTSIGIAIRRSGETDAEVLLRRADAALYDAKASGRGRFVVHE